MDIEAKIPAGLYSDGKPRTYEEIDSAYRASPFHDENERTYGMILQYYDILEKIINVVTNEKVINGETQWEIVEPFTVKLGEVADTLAKAFSKFDRKQHDGVQDKLLQPERTKVEEGMRAFFPALDRLRLELVRMAEYEEAKHPERIKTPFPIGQTPKDYWGPNRSALAKAYEKLSPETGQQTIVAVNNVITHTVLLGDRMHEIHGMRNILPKRAPGKDIIAQRSQREQAFAIRP